MASQSAYIGVQWIKNPEVINRFSLVVMIALTTGVNANCLFAVIGKAP